MGLEYAAKPDGQVQPCSGGGSGRMAGPATAVQVGSPACCMLRAVPTRGQDSPICASWDDLRGTEALRCRRVAWHSRPAHRVVHSEAAVYRDFNWAAIKHWLTGGRAKAHRGACPPARPGSTAGSLSAARLPAPPPCHPPAHHGSLLFYRIALVFVWMASFMLGLFNQRGDAG